jgi:hypothetical protein
MTSSPEYYYLDGQRLTAVDNNNDGTKTPVIAPSNITAKFREAFETYNPTKIDSPWNEIKDAGDLVFVDGNTAGASYLVVSKSPWALGSETRIESRSKFNMPVEVSFGAHMSQRVVGQEFSVEIVDTGAPLAETPDLAISSISQTTTVLTVNTVLPHGLTVGRCVGVYGVSNPAANYPQLVVATIPTPTQFTCAVATGTITTVNNSGFVYLRERFGRANNAVSQIFENATVTNANLYIRSESGDSLPSGTIAGNQATTVGTTASVQLVNAAYSYAFSPTTEFRINVQADRTQWYDSAVDAIAATTSRLLRTQICPDPGETYKLRIRANNAKSLTVPVAQIISAVKTGTTTATITCDRAHGLTTSDVVVIYGIRDQAAASFPNLATATAVASIVSPTVFTIVIGTASTVTSYGGYVARVNGGNLISALGAVAQVAQAAVLSTLADGTRQLVLTGSATWAAPATTIGDLVELVGVRNNATGASLNVDGPWKIANVVTTALTLVLPFNGQRALPADFGSVNCGGGVIRRTDLRMSFIRIFDYERERVEALARPAGDISAAFPVSVQGGTVAVSGTVTTSFTQPALVAGTALIGDVGVQYRTTASGASAQHLVSAATTNATLVKNAAGKVLGWYFSNTTAAWVYVKLHNQSTTPTAGSGVVRTIGIPPNDSASWFSEGGITFTAGIGLTTVTGAADADTTAVTLNAIVGELVWA